jgi:hypothetical protein
VHLHSARLKLFDAVGIAFVRSSRRLHDTASSVRIGRRLIPIGLNEFTKLVEFVALVGI